MTGERTPGKPYAFSKDRSFTQQWARDVLPAVFDLVGVPNRVVDLGGAQGHWCKVCKELGVQETVCIDHPAMAEGVVIPAEEFRAHRLDKAIPAPIPSDLAMSIEFAEHVPGERGPDIVSFLCKSAPVVLFSAAQPFQPGNGHINGQWPQYWSELFHSNGHVQLDVVRPRIIRNDRVPWWLRQNLFLFVSDSAPIAESLGAQSPGFLPDDFVLVHRNSLPKPNPEPKGVRVALRDLRFAVGNSMRARVGRRRTQS